MTVEEVIRRADDIRPDNAFSEEQKLNWVAELEGRLLTEVLLLEPEEVESEKIDYSEGGMDRELSAPWPHDTLYILWLMARMDEANGEYDRYQNAMQVFNAAWDGFLRWYMVKKDRAEREALQGGVLK